MIRLYLNIDRDALEATVTDLDGVTERLHTAVRTVVLPKLQPSLQRALNTPPGPVSKPFAFATAKSRAFYFANFRPPYRRTGRVLSWMGELEVDGRSGTILSVNDTPYARWVYGPRQVPGHANTGWPNATAQALSIAPEAEGLVIGAWFNVTLPSGRRKVTA